MTKLAIWLDVVKEDQAFFDKIWQGPDFPPAMALEVIKMLTMPPNNNFKVKECRG